MSSSESSERASDVKPQSTQDETQLELFSPFALGGLDFLRGDLLFGGKSRLETPEGNGDYYESRGR